jgi:hypothetical protein
MLRLRRRLPRGSRVRTIVTPFTEGAAGLTDSTVINPSGPRGIDAPDHRLDRGRTPAPDEVASLGLEGLAGLLQLWGLSLLAPVGLSPAGLCALLRTRLRASGGVFGSSDGQIEAGRRSRHPPVHLRTC